VNLQRYAKILIEEEQETIPSEPMAESRNFRGNGERIEGAFPIQETNGDTKMKSISPSALPHFLGILWSIVVPVFVIKGMLHLSPGCDAISR